MATAMYLGYPPENIKKWIKENYKPAFNSAPLCFTAEEAGSTVKMSKSGSAPTVYLETSPTGEEGSWSSYNVGDEITLENIGDKVYFRAKQDNEKIVTSYNDYNYFVMTGKIAASGNLNTLLKADGSVDNLSEKDYCYYNMFNSCTALTKAPELPATTLADYCYMGMFNGCTSLTEAPELPATTFKLYCYDHMFYNCKNLSSVTTYFENWGENADSTGYWLKNTSETGVLKCLKSNLIDGDIPRNPFTIPIKWTIETID